MSVVHRVRRRQRSLVLPLVLVPLLLTSSVALAADDEPATDTVVGELVQAWADPAKVSEADDEQYASPLTWVETDDGETVRIPTDQVEDLPVGATVEVAVGDDVVDEASQETGLEPAREVLAAEVVAPAADPPPAPAAAPLTNQVTVVMVVPQGGVQDSTTLTQVVDAVNGPVATFWSEESQGAIRIGVTASHDWMATTASCSTPTALWDEVAGAVGFTPGPGKHLLLYVTSAPASLSGCSYGLGQVGSGPASGGRMYVRDTVTSVIAHELGHNFRLGHSSGRQCDGAIEAGTCRTVAYRDDYDVMGVSWEQVGSLNAAQANLLNVLPGAQTATVLASGAGDRLTLAPLSGRSGIRAARLVDDDGQEYWLEYRTASGRDAWLAGSSNRFGLQAGVLLRPGHVPERRPRAVGHLPAARRDTLRDHEVGRGHADRTAGRHRGIRLRGRLDRVGRESDVGGRGRAGRHPDAPSLPRRVRQRRQDVRLVGRRVRLGPGPRRASDLDPGARVHGRPAGGGRDR